MDIDNTYLISISKLQMSGGGKIILLQIETKIFVRLGK